MVQKLVKLMWKIMVLWCGVVCIYYLIYVNEFGLRICYVDVIYVFFLGLSVFFYLFVLCSLLVCVEFDLFEGWCIVGGFECVLDMIVMVLNYDVFVDSLIEVGEYDFYLYEQNGKIFEVVVWLVGVVFDQENLFEDFVEIIDEYYDIFGSVFFDCYVFLFYVSFGVCGGIEYLNSMIMQMSFEVVEGSFECSEVYKCLFGFILYEFFYIWNVKVLCFDGIQFYDYQNENYLMFFWVVEGMMSYYDQLMLV